MAAFEKQELVRYIEAYAASKPTGNELLQTWAASMLSGFLDGLEVSAVEPEPEPELEAEPEVVACEVSRDG